MKKLSIFAVAIAALAFTACGGNKSTQNVEEEQKSFDQTQIEEKIKLEIDSLAAGVGKLKHLPIVQDGENGLKLTDEEKQVKPDYLLDPAVAENAATLAEKYRMISALTVDKNIAKLYDMPVDTYEKAIAKLVTEVNDPSFKDMNTNNIYETAQTLYDSMNQNGRINYFWQLAATSLVEEMYVLTQNTDKFITAFDDESASNITYRTTLLVDAVDRLAVYDPEIEPVAEAMKPLGDLNAISVEQLKTQLAEMKEDVIKARAALVK